MGLAQKSLAYIEPEDYLHLEAHSKEKHEYLDGVIYAWQGNPIRGMAGASMDHNRVALNIATALHRQLRGSNCQVLNSDTRVRPHENSAYFYPDVSVRCGPKLPGTTMEINDACVVIEVLSSTTEGFDRQDKFDRYQHMASLQTYVLVHPTQRTIEVFRRDSQWQPPTQAEASSSDSRLLGLHGLSLAPEEAFEGL